MDPVTVIDTVLNSLGYGQYIVVISAVVGLASAVSSVYPPTWKGAGAVHKVALLVGNAKPATPASTDGK
jgi:hypothetical protein